MLKWTGAGLILLGCVLPALRQTAALRRRRRQLGAFALALEHFRRRLELQTPEMGALLRSLPELGEEAVQNFFRSLSVDDLSRRSFARQWREGLDAPELNLGETARESLLALGRVLGQYDREEQCESLRRAAAELERFQRETTELLRQYRRVWLPVSASAGVMVVLLLL